MQGKPKVDDEKYRIEIEITESPEFKVRFFFTELTVQLVCAVLFARYNNSYFKAAVDKMVQKTNLSALVSTGSWAEQFSEALQVSAGKLTGTMPSGSPRTSQILAKG